MVKPRANIARSLFEVLNEITMNLALSKYCGPDYIANFSPATETSKNSQRCYTTKRLIRDLLSNTPNCYVRGGELREYLLQGMRDRSMRSGTKFAREIQLTDWSTAGNLSNLSSGVQISRDICTRFRRYLYSRRCSWIITRNIDGSRISKTIRRSRYYRKIHYLTREFRVKLHAKTDIARIAKR